MIRVLSRTPRVSPRLYAVTRRYYSSPSSSSTSSSDIQDIKTATDDYDFTNSFRTLSVQGQPIPDSSLPHSYIMGSETYGQIVNDFHYDKTEGALKKIKVIDFEDQNNEFKEEATNDLTGEESRLHPDVLKGRINRRQIKIPDIVLKTIGNKILIHQDPKKLRIKLSKIFVDLNETGIQVPSRDSPLDVDANIASFFVQNYGEVYQPLYELQKRVGKENFNPKRILEVGYGPSTGMIALNELMGENFNPDLKHSFIIGSYEMQKRAKVILSRQLCEYNGLKNDIKKTEAGEEILEGSDLVSNDDGASHDINTKKINIKTKLLSYVPETENYDLIILSHQLLTSIEGFPLEIDEVMDEYLSKLKPNGHIVIVERGSPLGFEIVARARQITMRPENHPDSNAKAPRLYIKGSSTKPKNELQQERPDYYLRIVAPCNHHGECPLQLKTLEPYSYGGKLANKINWCHFNATIARPKFLMELKKGKLMGAEWDPENQGIAPKGMASVGTGRSYANDFESLSYSYLILQRTAQDLETLDLIERLNPKQHELGTPGINIDEWPRLMKTPLKKKGMIVGEVCGASGKIEKWIIPKSFGKQEYHDARKLQQGDLWPLDAKTKLESSKNAANLIERIEKKESNIKKKAKMDKKQEKRMARKKIESKQLELDSMEPNEDNLFDRIENLGLQMDLKMKDIPKVKKFNQGKYKY